MVILLQSFAFTIAIKIMSNRADQDFVITKLQSAERTKSANESIALRKFYKNTIGRLPGARVFVLWTFGVLGRAIGRVRKKPKFRIVKQGASDARKVANGKNLFDSRNSCISAAHCRTSKIPAFDIYEVNDAVIVGGTNMVIHNRSLISHDLYNFEFDLTSEELWQRVTASSNCESFYLNIDHRPRGHIDCAISLLDACSSNYCHWVSEILPKLVMTLSNENMREVPIVIDENLHENILQSLRCIVGPGTKIYSVEFNLPISIHRLYMPSVCGYVPFGVKKENVFGEFHGAFYVPALKLLKNRVMSNVSVSDDKKFRRLYLSRRSKIRSVINFNTVEALIKKNGFEIVYPEDYSFLAQAKLFNGASHIIAPTGAALVNAVFCSPGTEICVLMGEHPEMIYDYWKNMLQPMGLNIDVMKCLMVNKNAGIHGSYIVDSLSLSNVIREWGLS